MRVLLICRSDYPEAQAQAENYVQEFNDAGIATVYLDPCLGGLERAGGGWDWAFVQGKRALSLEGFRELRERAKKTLIWEPDTLNEERRRIWEEIRREVDIVVCSSLYVSEELAKMGINTHFIPQAYDPRLNTPTVSRLETVIHDVVFIGRAKDGLKRDEWIKLLTERYNMGWYGHPLVMGSEMADILMSSKLAIDIKRDNFEYGAFTVSSRLFKTLGCGAPFLTFDVPSLELFFTPGIHLDTYEDNFNALCAKIDYYLEHEEEREQIAIQGHQEVLVHHLLLHRIRDMIDLMESNG